MIKGQSKVAPKAGMDWFLINSVRWYSAGRLIRKIGMVKLDY